MPLRMLRTDDGEPKLIAELPIDEEALAQITYMRDGQLYRVLASYQGGQMNGHPALSPLMYSLEQRIVDLIETEREMHVHNAGLWLDEKRYPLPRFQMKHDTALELTTSLKAAVPTIPLIQIDKKLSIAMPQPFTTRHALGVTNSWHISRP